MELIGQCTFHLQCTFCMDAIVACRVCAGFQCAQPCQGEEEDVVRERAGKGSRVINPCAQLTLEIHPVHVCSLYYCSSLLCCVCHGRPGTGVDS